VVLEWDPIRLATAELLGLSLYRNGQKAGAIPRPLTMTSTKISGLAVDTEYAFHLVLRTTAGTYISEKVPVRTHKMTDLSGVTITMGIMPGGTRDALNKIIGRIGARIADEVRIDTTHFVTTEGRGVAWERAAEMNIPVVRPEWVDACEKSGRILGVTKFYLDAVRPVSVMGAPSGIGLGSETASRDLPERPRAESRAERVEREERADRADSGERIPERNVEEGKPEEKGPEEQAAAGTAAESEAETQEEADKTDDTSAKSSGLDDKSDSANEGESKTDAGGEAAASDPTAESKSRKSTASEGGKSVEDKGRALASPDGATFQDVAL
jgi:hypothetical protein